MRKKRLMVLALAIGICIVLAMTTSAAATPDDMPPKGAHYDVNFVTGGKIAFTSILEGTTTPTTPPFYWHEDFDSTPAGTSPSGWIEYGDGTWAVEKDATAPSLGPTGYGDVYCAKASSTTYTRDFSFISAASGFADGVFEFSFNLMTDEPVTPRITIPVRYQDEDNWVLFDADTGVYRTGYYIFVSYGGWHELAGVSDMISTDTWHTMRIVLDGWDYEMWIDGTLKLTATDYTEAFPSGEIGLGVYRNTHAHFDDVTLLGPTGLSQSWIDDGPWYTETRTIVGTLSAVDGGPIEGSMTIESTSTLNAVTGEGSSSGTFEFTNTAATGGFCGTILADNTNFGVLDGTFVSDTATGIYMDRTVEGTFNGYFYESAPGAGYDSFHATIVGIPADNEILVRYDDTVAGLAYVFGPEFRLLDNDAGVFDGDCAVLQIPEGMIFDIYCSARGKPGGHMEWGSDHARADVPAGKPTWHQHNPDNFDLRNFVLLFKLGEFGPQFGPYPITSHGCTILATRWYPQEMVYPYDWIVVPLYNWYDGKASPYDPNAYHPMTEEWYVGIMSFKASSGNLRVDIALTEGKPSTTYQVLLWYNYGMSGQGYWTIGTLTTGISGRASIGIDYALAAGTYVLGIDLKWDDGTNHQEILSAGNGLLGLQNSVTIP
jgi:hypothetical protein